VTSSRLETLLLTYCQLVPSLRRTHTHSRRYGREVVAGWRRTAILFHRGVLGRAGKSGAVAMDAKWLLGRASESVVAIGCCVKWAGPNIQSVLVHTFYPY